MIPNAVAKIEAGIAAPGTGVSCVEWYRFHTCSAENGGRRQDQHPI